MIHLTLEQLLQLHILVVSATGGADGVRDVGRLESAVQVQSQQVFDADIYPELYDKAAAMIRNIITDHPFVDGNKRTAMLVGLTLLELNGMRFVAQPGELEDFTVGWSCAPSRAGPGRRG